MLNKKELSISLLAVSLLIFTAGNSWSADKYSSPEPDDENQEIFSEPETFYFETSRMPEISELKSSNAVFKEYSFIVEDNYKAQAAGKPLEMIFFKAKIPEDMSLISLASRCCIPYDTIASINGLENSSSVIAGKTLILPVVKGLFIKKNNCKTSLEILLHEKYSNEILTKENNCYNIDGKDFIFLSGKEFSPTERAYFVDSALRLPLDKETFWISSEFGRRKNPFSGEWKDHKGIDLAAVEGTPVYAIKDGTAAFCISNDSTFGNYIILSHDNGAMTSVYAHLSKIAISKNKAVKKGDVIGYVGSTGLATGSHLHFEIRQGGVPLNPKKKLNLN